MSKEEFRLDPHTTIMCRTAGHPFGDWMAVEASPTSCGAIADGVTFRPANCEDPRNQQQIDFGWVMPFSDLERAYLAAKRLRDGLKP